MRIKVGAITLPLVHPKMCPDCLTLPRRLSFRGKGIGANRLCCSRLAQSRRNAEVAKTTRRPAFAQLRRGRQSAVATAMEGHALSCLKVGRDGAHPSSSVITRLLIAGCLIVVLTSCATTPRHQFAEPTREWQTRSGQLLYRKANATLIGEVLVRFSKDGDFELTFSKGPGVTLLVLQQDATFAQVKGPIARTGWTGPIERAPSPLRAWLGLRDKFARSRDRPTVRHVVGGESFLFRF